LWNEKEKIWSSDVPLEPLKAIQPAIALKQRGFRTQTAQSLGHMKAEGKLLEVAAELNRRDSTVLISNAFPREIQHFTLAHELGHVVLNHDGELLHRDIPVERKGYQKDVHEREADWFATCFVMPARQVRAWFRELFVCDRFVLNDDTAFALGIGTKSLAEIGKKIRCARDLTMMLARAMSYGGRPIPPLHRLFNVSATAMARRLEELGLVPDPDFLPRRSNDREA
jgi:Zn-dependent peptidase ImmA (M78 family)